MHGEKDTYGAAFLMLLLQIGAIGLPVLGLPVFASLGFLARRRGSQRLERFALTLFGLCMGLILAGAVFLLVGCQPALTKDVVLYCAQDQVFAEPILADFTKQTGIHVKSVFDSEAVKTVGLANRLLAEQGHPVCDVFWGNEEFRTRQLAAAGVFRETNGWTAFGQRSRRLVVNEKVISNQLSVNQSAANAAALPVTDSPNTGSLITPPASLVELTNSRWQGKVSLAFPLFGTTSTHLNALRQHWGESNWLVWCRALAANRPFLEEGNSHVVQRVARGEAWVGLTDSDDIESGRREGLPVAALPLTPELLLIPNTVGVIRGGPHPAAAQQLFDYLQQPVVRERLVAAAALEAETPAAPALKPDWTALVHDLDRATDQLKEVFRR